MNVGVKRFGNVFAHQGLQLDAEIGSYQNRARQYAPKFKRFMQADLLALPGRRFSARSRYRDGMNLYECLRSSPLAHLDPEGLETYCGTVTCGCKTRPAGSPVYGDSERAKKVFGERDGCITLILGVGGRDAHGIYCTASCEEIKGMKRPGGVPLLEHECCHYCDGYDGGLCVYLLGALFDTCDTRKKSATPSW